MEILVCVKRVPATAARITITADGQSIDTRHLGFAVSPHEECAVEAAIQIVEAHGGNSTVLTLGPADAEEQLRYALSQGVDNAILLESGGEDWGPMATASAIVAAVKDQAGQGAGFDLLLFGNESADSGGYQVGIRVAKALGLACVTGVKSLEIRDDAILAKKETTGGFEVYEVPLPAVITVKEGINLPRYPSLKGRMRAKKVEIQTSKPSYQPGNFKKVRLMVPEQAKTEVEILGTGVEAAPKVIALLKDLGMV